MVVHRPRLGISQSIPDASLLLALMLCLRKGANRLNIQLIQGMADWQARCTELGGQNALWDLLVSIG